MAAGFDKPWGWEWLIGSDHTANQHALAALKGRRRDAHVHQRWIFRPAVFGFRPAIKRRLREAAEFFETLLMISGRPQNVVNERPVVIEEVVFGFGVSLEE